MNPSLVKDYDAVDGLRGLAILMVVCGHLFYVNPAGGKTTLFIGELIAAGGWGVTLFFALSGFLISHPFWKRKIQGSPQTTPRGYIGRRFWKIYPPLALSILLLTPIYYVRLNDPSFFADAGKWLIGWPLILPVPGGLNPVMWSLVVEVHFYAVLPLLFLGLRSLSPRATLVALFLILLIIPTAFRWWNLSRGLHIELFPLIQVRFPSLLDAFAFGILLAGLENLQLTRKSWARLGDIGLLLLGAAIFAKAWFHFHPFTDSADIQNEIISWGPKIAAALLLCYIADPAYRSSRLFSFPALRWLGIISYEWYLFHQPIVLWARQSFGPAEGNLVKYLAIVGGSFVFSLLLGALIYRLFSLPILKFGRARHRAS